MLVIIIVFLGFKIYTGKIGNKVKYDNSYFWIATYHSNMDKDNDGVDDQTDILNSVRSYIATKPKYDSKYLRVVILMMGMEFVMIWWLLVFWGLDII